MSYVKHITNHQAKHDLDFTKKIIRDIQRHYHYSDKQMWEKFPDLYKFKQEMELNNIKVENTLFVKYAILVED